MVRRTTLFLLISVSIFACREKQKTLQESELLKSNQAPSARYVTGNILVSEELPAIEIEVADEFEYVGTFNFEIIANSAEYPKELQGKAVAAGDRYVFVSANSGQVVNKLFIVQLEGFLPDNDFTFNYNFDTAEFIGKNKYRNNTWFYDSKKLAKENPNNEGALTRAYLQDKGYQLEDEFMMSRFVGLASEDRKHEIIIYYLEMLHKTTGYSLEEYEEGMPMKEADSIQRALVDRSKRSFKIIKG